jgi:tetratricopeptide (TPR) repeat protein
LSEEKYLLSIQNFERCIELDGEDGLTLCYLGECNEQLGNLEEAKQFYYKSLEKVRTTKIKNNFENATKHQNIKSLSLSDQNIEN